MIVARRVQNIGEVRVALDAIETRLSARDEVDAERRKVDDVRDAKLQEIQTELLRRTDTLETNWKNFFGKEGAFRMVTAQIQAHGTKIDRLMVYGGIAMGVFLVLQLLMQAVIQEYLRGAH
ncbi:MAG: hypothetical protein ACLGQX_02860 [Acidobacteriota bacterium]|jgi:hypothetical protein